MRHPNGETITIHPRIATAGEDENGNPIPGWGPDITRPGCAIAPHVEPIDADPNRSMVITGLDVYDTVDSPVGPHDEVTVRGVRYKVNAQIARWHNPFRARREGCVITLKEVAG